MAPPARQRLSTDNLACPEIDLRLEHSLELAIGHGFAQFVFQLVFPARNAGQARCEETETGCRLIAHKAQRQFRMPEQFLRTVGIFRRHHDPAGNAEGHRLSIQFEWRGKRLANSPRNRGDMFAADSVRHVDGKLVGLKRGNRRVAKRCTGWSADPTELVLQSLARLRQQGVARIAAQLFGGAREPIQVQHDQGGRSLERRLRQSGRNRPVDSNHVRQAGAGVDKGRLAQQRILTAQFSDCACHTRPQPAQFGKLHVGQVCASVATGIIEIIVEPVQRVAKLGRRQIGCAPGSNKRYHDLDSQHDRRVRQG